MWLRDRVGPGMLEAPGSITSKGRKAGRKKERKFEEQRD